MASGWSGSGARSTCRTRRSSAPSSVGPVASEADGIVVDLTECEFIDSSGVRVLLLSREAQESEKEADALAIAASSEQILRILSVMGIDRVIPICPTVDEAAAALSG